MARGSGAGDDDGDTSGIGQEKEEGAAFRFGDFRVFSVAAVVKSALLGRLGG
ncbi:hypothetical protein [Oryza sativa Japonica Group]|uniref:Uncharacterized protein n=1 Tax=Oryza sativa subsp. japonica TaxID=39947 RepID=Q5ZEF9_ORYSJ|nr:hypothetical protein [Oryza sativa Japonica Group]